MDQLTIDVNTDLGTNSIGYKLLMKDGVTYTVTAMDMETYTQSYPHLDVEDQMRRMVSWCYSRKEKKRKKDAKRFINNWLNSQRPDTTRFERASTQSTRDTSIADDLTGREWAK